MFAAGVVMLVPSGDVDEGVFVYEETDLKGEVLEVEH